MTFEKKLLLIALFAFVLAIPVSYAMRHRSHQLQIQRSENGALQVELMSKQKLIEKREAELKAEAKRKAELQKENRELQKQLQSKRNEQQKRLARAAVKPSVVVASAVSAGGNCEAYRSLVAQYDWNVNVALAVMRAESGCRPGALSPTCDRGLLQINCVHSAKVGGNLASLFDPATNVRVAYQVYAGAGWSAWSVCKNGIVSCSA